MITSRSVVADDLAELGSLSWDVVTFETLLDVHGVDYRDEHKSLSDLMIAEKDELVFWVSFTLTIANVTLHEYHRWYVSDSGSICRAYRIKGEENVHA